MKILKRNQLVILVISLMLVTAGYLNFTSTNSKINSTEVVADLGDATLVNSNKIENELVKNGDNDIAEEAASSISQNTVQQAENNETIETVKNENDKNATNENQTNEVIETVKEDTYFTTSKLDRENIYSQTLETYQEIYNNANSTPEQKEKAIQEISNINKMRNAIMIAENLVIAKGFEDIVIFANSNCVSVIIKAENLEPEQIAQIQNIVSRELEVGAEAINISTK